MEQIINPNATISKPASILRALLDLHVAISRLETVSAIPAGSWLSMDSGVGCVEVFGVLLFPRARHVFRNLLMNLLGGSSSARI